MNAQHTPGPWRVDSHPESRRADAVYGSGYGKVAYCQAMFGRPHVPEHQIEANARLIAAAPDLLEALERLVSAADRVADDANTSMMDDEIDAARAAIARARARARGEA